jgi:hypothetical protein
MNPQTIPITKVKKVAPSNHKGKTGVIGSLFKAKRRASQAIREKIGSSKSLTSNIDQDDSYIQLYNQVLQTEKEYDALGSSFGKFAMNLQTWTRASRLLASCTEHFFNQPPPSSPTTTTTTTTTIGNVQANEGRKDVHPEFQQSINKFNRAAIKVDDDIRRHVSKEYIEHVIGPLKVVVIDQIPTIKIQHEERHGFAIDIASYRRRLRKQKDLNIKSGETDKRNELIATLESKLKAAESNFNNLDIALRREMQFVVDNKYKIVSV